MVWVLLGFGVLATVAATFLGYQAHQQLAHDLEADAVVTGFEPHIWHSRSGVAHTEYRPRLQFRDQQGTSHTIIAGTAGKIGTKVGDHEPVLYETGIEDYAIPKAEIWDDTVDAVMAAVFCLAWAGIARFLGKALLAGMAARRKGAVA